jgi:hypothetical protein
MNDDGCMMLDVGRSWKWTMKSTINTSLTNRGSTYLNGILEAFREKHSISFQIFYSSTQINTPFLRKVTCLLFTAHTRRHIS